MVSVIMIFCHCSCHSFFFYFFSFLIDCYKKEIWATSHIIQKGENYFALENFFIYLLICYSLLLKEYGYTIV